MTAALNKVLMPLFGRGPRVRHADKAADHAVNVTRDETMPAEAYRLFVTPCRIDIVAGGAQGAFYAVQTLRQLLPAAAYEADDVRAVELPVVTIEDKPCLGYRGMMLDVGRHFFTVDEVKEALDIMALHKLNVFHWHLTDDQGWRIEIRKYPKLTEIGSVRSRTLIGRDPGGTYDENCKFDETPYGGYYTQDEIRDVVNYAAERFITVIPEIEFPGHAVGALASYPWLGCTGEQYEVRQTWDIDDRVFCIGKETTFEFIEKVLTEVLALFPSKLIHIGGDECPKGRWKACPLCQQRIREEGLKDEYQLQSYFIHRIERWMHTHGREIIGWDEILQGGISKTANIMSWNGTATSITARPPTRSVTNRWATPATSRCGRLTASTPATGSRCPTRNGSGACSATSGRSTSRTSATHCTWSCRAWRLSPRRAGPTTARITTISCAGFRRWSPSTRPKATTTPPICSRASNDTPAALPKPNTPQVL